MRYTKILFVILLSILVMLTLVSCSTPTSPSPTNNVNEPTDTPTEQPSKTPSQTPTDAPTATPTQAPTVAPTVTPSKTPENINPLTGLEIDKKYTDTRPISVMFNNLKKATPQWGIGDADVIYEALAEGGITRLVGLYQNPFSVVKFGSVRSTRAYYLDIVTGHDSIMVHAGGSEEALNMITDKNITTINAIKYDGKYFQRDEERRVTVGYAHSLYTTGSLLDTAVSKLKLSLDHNDSYKAPYIFGESSAANGKTANKISLTYSHSKNTTLEYDAQNKVYKLNQFGDKLIDANNNKQVTVKNALIIFADFDEIEGDDEGRLKVDFTRGGSGYYCCNGKYINITWSKASANDQFVYTDSDGNNIVLEAGKSYIGIVPVGSSYSID